jgi:CheY-like chemotaxis protein
MNKRVLLVDDEAAVRRQLKVGMMQMGFDASESEDGLTALETIEQRAREGRPFNFVVTDMRLPDIDGLKLLNIIKSRYPAMRVIVISGYGQEDTGEQVKLRNGDGFVPKPFDVQELASMMEGMEAIVAPTPEADASLDVSASTYVFARIASASDPLEVFDSLAYQDGVLYCDAVRDGQWDLVLLVHGSNADHLEQKVKKMFTGWPGIESFLQVPVGAPYLSADVQAYIDDYNRENAGNHPFDRNRHRATSYLMVDLDPNQLESLYTRLYFMDEVVEIDAALSGRQLVLLLHGGDFSRIRHAISRRIRMLDGVLKLHELKVIPLNEF